MKSIRLICCLFFLIALIVFSFSCISKPKDQQVITKKISERIFSTCKKNRKKYSLIKNFGVYFYSDDTLIEISLLNSSDPGNFVGVPTKTKVPDEIIVYFDKISPASLDIKELVVGEKKEFRYWIQYTIGTGFFESYESYFTDSIAFNIEPIKDEMYLIKTKSELEPGFYCILGINNQLYEGIIFMGGFYDKAYCFEIIK